MIPLDILTLTAHRPAMAYRKLTPEERQRVRENLQANKSPESIEELKNQLRVLKTELEDWKWAYSLTEGILKSDPKWQGVNDRFLGNKPIEAAKLAKDLMGKRNVPSHITQSVPSLVIPDYYGDLINWLKAKPWRKVMNVGNGWLVRDEAMSREIRHASLDDLLKTEDWIKFKKGL